MSEKNGSAKTKPVSTREADRILRKAASRAEKRLRLSSNGEIARSRRNATQ